MPTMAPYSDPSSCQLLLAIGTADYLHMIQVKSIQFSRQLTRQRGVANEYTSSRLLVVAVFKVHPLELVACLSVDRKIFGGDIQDASLNQDVLVVAHSTGYYRMYSLPWIIKHYSVVKATLGEWVELGGTRAGVMGFGVPLTLNITERPPLLFEVRSGSELGVSFGGSPTVYLYNPSPKDNSVFFLRSLQSGKLVAKFSTDTVAFHQDVVDFHHDDYLRIMHISGSTVSCYQLVEEGVVKLYTTDFRSLSKRKEIVINACLMYLPTSVNKMPIAKL
ncbi:DDB1- and CUL4-associated factor 17-like isoform X5 [Halichondria panicea]|uniref:DDB1- and CUL4-associated factor 17-like isoform X5 n=1 Tax=Halichondria panicea TaxID=6063 RepID=UPI00312B9FD4